MILIIFEYKICTDPSLELYELLYGQKAGPNKQS